MRNTFLLSCFLLLAFFSWWQFFRPVEKHGGPGGRGPALKWQGDAINTDVMRHTEPIEKRGP